MTTASLHPWLAELLGSLDNAAARPVLVASWRSRVHTLEDPDEVCRLARELLLLAYYYDESIRDQAAANAVIAIAQMVAARLGPHASPLNGQRLRRVLGTLSERIPPAHPRTGLHAPATAVKIRAGEDTER